MSDSGGDMQQLARYENLRLSCAVLPEEASRPVPQRLGIFLSSRVISPSLYSHVSTMSYRAQHPRPNSNGRHAQGQDVSPAFTSTRASNSSQTSLDWSSFVSFQQLPGNVSTGAQYQNAPPRQGRTEENFQAFAQAIAENGRSPSSINFVPPQHRSALQLRQTPRQPSPLQQNPYSQGDSSSRPSSSGSSGSNLHYRYDDSVNQILFSNIKKRHGESRVSSLCSQSTGILLGTTPEETNAPSRCPRQESKTPPLPATPYTSLLCRAPRSTSIGPKKGMEKQPASSPRLDNLYTSQYDPIGVGLDPGLLSRSNHRAGAGLSLPFPPQSKISDFDSLFNRRTNRSGTLHILSGGDLDGGAYGYDPPLLRRDLHYTNTSTSLSSLLEIGSNTGSGTRNSRSPNDSPEQGFRCE